MPLLGTRGAASARGFGFGGATETPTGAFIFVRNNYQGVSSFSLTIPDNVFSISMAAVGGGGGGAGGESGFYSLTPAGGGGGALVYSNNVAVTPGEVLTISPGSGGAGGDPSFYPGYNGTDSTVQRGATTLLLAKAGSRGLLGTSVGAGGSAASCIGQFAYSGGNGGAGINSPSRAGGGGGSGGWAGSGGNGGANGAGTNGAGGAGGGGGAAIASTTQAYNGGATLWYGQGANGTGGSSARGNLGSSLGGSTEGPAINYSTATQVGVGGGAGYQDGGYGREGGGGWVRIVFGPQATFPSTITSTNEFSFIASSNSTSSTIQIPSSAKVGDLVILIDAWSSSSFGSVNIPNGFRYLNGSVGVNGALYYSGKQILSPSEIGSTITATNAVPSFWMNKTILVFRGTRGASFPQLGIKESEFEVTTAPAPQTLSYSPYDSYAFGIPIMIGFFRGSNGITPASDITFSGATFVQGATNVWFVGYKIFPQSTTSFNQTISMVDRGTNTMTTAVVGAY